MKVSVAYVVGAVVIVGFSIGATVLHEPKPLTPAEQAYQRCKQDERVVYDRGHTPVLYCDMIDFNSVTKGRK